MSKRRMVTVILMVVGIGLTLSIVAWDRWVAGRWCEHLVTVDLKPGDNVVQHMISLKEQLPSSGDRVLAHLKMRSWEGRLKAGRYQFPQGESVKNSAARLATGNREAVQVLIRAGRDVGPIAGAATRHIHADSSRVATMLSQDSMMWRVIPNTYEMWWESDAQTMAQRLIFEHKQWWSEDRLDAARALGLTPREVTILASIVQAETAVISEAPLVASLYLNRLQKNMALQADPTLIFALRDPSIRRVLDEHKEVDSPYNTYQNLGLPPGPIRFVDPRYLQSVLHPVEHNFFYMCAKPGNTTHNFARTYREHLRNARAYQRWLNKQRIFR